MTLHPQYFCADLRNSVVRRLHTEVEGTCAGQLGYIVCVLDVVDLGAGELNPSTGFAEYVVIYKAVVFRPFRNQVIDAVVTTVNKMGFFAEVGPLQVFVSSHLIPSSIKFDSNSNPPAYMGDGDEEDLRIEKGEVVRLRIVGTRIDSTEIFAIGTIKEDFLGPGVQV